MPDVSLLSFDSVVSSVAGGSVGSASDSGLSFEHAVKRKTIITASSIAMYFFIPIPPLLDYICLSIILQSITGCEVTL
jgi:hypothetical protein